MTQTISKSAAIKQARSEVLLYPQGRGWILSVYDENARLWRVSHELQWGTARNARKHQWNARAYELMGYSHDDAEKLAFKKPL